MRVLCPSSCFIFFSNEKSDGNFEFGFTRGALEEFLVGGDYSCFGSFLLHQLGGEGLGLAVDEGTVEGEELLEGRDGLRAGGGVGGGVGEIVDAEELIGLAAVDGAVQRAAAVVLGVEVLRCAADCFVEQAAGVQHRVAPCFHIEPAAVHAGQMFIGRIRLLCLGIVDALLPRGRIQNLTVQPLEGPPVFHELG